MTPQQAKINRTNAKQKGFKTYDGRPCKACGSAEKYVSNNTCKACTQTKTKHRSPDVYKKFIKSEKGKLWLANYRKTETYRLIQRRWSTMSGFHRQQQHRRRSIIYNSLIQLTEEEFQRVVSVYKEAARLANNTGIPHHVDHIKPLADGGLHHPDNLQILKESDHHTKTACENKERMNGKNSFNN